jgi:hypothetical protein
VFLIVTAFCFAEGLTFSNQEISEQDMIDGIVVNTPLELAFIDTVFTFPNLKPINPDSIICTYDFYLIIMSSPYVCKDCYRAGFDPMTAIPEEYYDRVILLVEGWTSRDVKNDISHYNLDKNIMVLYDKEGINIRRFSNLAECFINEGFLIVDRQLNVHFVMMASYMFPFTHQREIVFQHIVRKYFKNN